jgi:hypothetical protein
MKKFPARSDLCLANMPLEKLIGLIPSIEILDPILDDFIMKVLEEEGGSAHKSKIVKKLPHNVRNFLKSIYNTSISNIVANRGNTLIDEGELVRYGLHESYQLPNYIKNERPDFNWAEAARN